VAGFPRRCFHAVVTYGNKVIAFGGRDAHNVNSNDLHCAAFSMCAHAAHSWPRT
jgi:hypothetical protein